MGRDAVSRSGHGHPIRKRRPPSSHLFRLHVTVRQLLLTWDGERFELMNTSAGRRGLLNLGQTCFMNAILQSFAANPLLRHYFLSDKHNYQLCKNDACICCEMDKFFTEVRLGFLVISLDP